MIQEFIPALNPPNYPTSYDDPYWKVIIDTKDRQNIRYDYLANWHRSTTCNKEKWNGSWLVGLSTTTSTTSADISKTVTFPYDGLYRIEIRAPRRASYSNGTISLLVDGTRIEDVKSAWHTWDHYHYFVYGARWFSEGSHSIQIHLTKPAYVDSIFITPIIRYEGSKDDNISPGSKEIDVSKTTWTMNAISELDTINVDAAMRPEFRNPLNDSKHVFGFTDSITLVAGPNRRNVEPIWGGYVLGPKPDGNKITINGISRFWDLERQPVYHNFSIGAAPKSDDVKTLPYISFSNVHDLGRYLAETAEYGINTAGVPYNYGFCVNLADPGQFDAITVTGFKKYYDTGFGHPKPSIKLTPDDLPGLAECVLWQSSDPWDAVTTPQMNIAYYVSGAGARYPLQFDIKVTMYNADETFEEAHEYLIRFTGKYRESDWKVIGTVKSVLNGTWQKINFNLKNLLDAKAQSSQYNITQVSIVGNITQDMVDHPKCSAVWFDEIYSYGTSSHAPHYVSADVKDAFEEFQQLCTNTDHVAYIVPGLERKDDILVLKYLDDAISSEVIADGIGGNYIEISNWDDDPINAGFCNQSHKTFNYKTDQTKVSYREDRASIAQYGPVQTHEFLDSVTTQADADKLAALEVSNHSHEAPGFSVDIEGSVIIEPLHYILADIQGEKIIGYNKIKSISQTIDRNSSPEFSGTVDLNRPGLLFLKNINKTRKALGLSERKISLDGYRQYGLSNLGSSGIGSFVNY